MNSLYFLDDSPWMRSLFQENKSKLESQTPKIEMGYLFPELALQNSPRDYILGLSASGLPPRRREDNFVLPFQEEGMAESFSWKSGEIYSCNAKEEKSIREFFSIYRSYWNSVDEIYIPFPETEEVFLGKISPEDWEKSILHRLDLQFVLMREIYPLLAESPVSRFVILFSPSCDPKQKNMDFLSKSLYDLFLSFQSEWKDEIQFQFQVASPSTLQWMTFHQYETN